MLSESLANVWFNDESLKPEVLYYEKRRRFVLQLSIFEWENLFCSLVFFNERVCLQCCDFEWGILFAVLFAMMKWLDFVWNIVNEMSSGKKKFKFRDKSNDFCVLRFEYLYREIEWYYKGQDKVFFWIIWTFPPLELLHSFSKRKYQEMDYSMLISRRY